MDLFFFILIFIVLVFGLYSAVTWFLTGHF